PSWPEGMGRRSGRLGGPLPARPAGEGGVSQMAASRAVAFSAGKPLHRAPAHARRPLVHAPSMPLRPQAIRAQAQALRSNPSFRFGVMLAASALAGAIVTVLQWHDDGVPAVVYQRDRAAALSDRPGTTAYPHPPPRRRPA